MDGKEWLEQFDKNKNLTDSLHLQHVCCMCAPKHLMDEHSQTLLDEHGNRIPADPNHMAKGIAYSHGICRDALKEHYPEVWQQLYGDK